MDSIKKVWNFSTHLLKFLLCHISLSLFYFELAVRGLLKAALILYTRALLPLLKGLLSVDTFTLENE